MKKKKKLGLPGVEKFNSKLLTLLVIIASAYVCLGISAILLIAYYGVPMGDDYLAIKTYENPSTWLNEAWLSLSTTSRYLQSVTSSITYGVLGHKIAVLLPVIVLIWFFILSSLYLQLGFKKLNLTIESWKVYGLSAATLVILVISGQAAESTSILFMYQTFFFSSAIVTYTICVLAFLTLFYLYLRYTNIVKKYPKSAFGIFVGISFLLSLFNETIPASLLSVTIALLAISFFKFPILHALKKIRPYLIGLAGANFLALIFMYLSPARAARSDFTGGLQTSNIIEPVLTKSVDIMSSYFTPATLGILVVISLITAISLVRVQAAQKTFSRTLFFGIATVLAGVLSLLVAVTFVVLGYGPSSSIVPRVLLLVQILLIIGAAVTLTGASGLTLMKLPNKVSSYAILVVVSIAIVLSITIAPSYINKISAAISTTENYHQIWEAQDELLHNAAATNANKTIFLPDEGAGIGDGYSIACDGPYSKFTIWLTDGMEAYYGVREICAESDLKNE